MKPKNSNNIAQFFVKNRQIAWVALFATLAWGVYGYTNMPKRKDPDIPVRIALAITPWPGISADNAELIEACLRMDEPAAVTIARDAIAAGKGPDLYGYAKQALNRWCRRAAVKPEWAGAGIPLNVIALGFFDTPAAAYILNDPKLREQMRRMVPMRAAYPGRPEQAAAVLAWCVSPENSLMTGQILFVDGGVECSVRKG